MKKLFIVLILLTGAASAEWVQIGESDAIDKYIDPATIRKDGNLRKVWELNNLKQRSKDGKFSVRARLEYDCDQERFRILSFSHHSGLMANGKTLFLKSNEDLTWEEIPPKSIGEMVLKIVCAS